MNKREEIKLNNFTVYHGQIFIRNNEQSKYENAMALLKQLVETKRECYEGIIFRILLILIIVLQQCWITVLKRFDRTDQPLL